MKKFSPRFLPLRFRLLPTPARLPASRVAALLAVGIVGAAVLPLHAQGTDTPASTASPDRIVVTASPLDRSAFDLAQPVSSLSGLDLKQRKTSTLGDTLNGEPGVSASGFTAGASRPIIRGQADNRVRVLNNGTEASTAPTAMGRCHP